MTPQLELVAPGAPVAKGVWQPDGPVPLWRVGDRVLIDHWLDHALRRGFQRVRLFTRDRAETVRGFLRQERRSARVATEVIEDDPPASARAQWLDGLPGQAPGEIPWGEPLAVLRHWHALQESWLSSGRPAALSGARERMPHGWVASTARVSKRARLEPPFWIGPGVEVAAGVTIGPFAIIERGSVLGEDASIRRSLVAAGTWVEPGRVLDTRLAQGGLVVDLSLGRREAYDGHSPSADGSKPGLAPRMLALACYYLLAAACAPGHRLFPKEPLDYVSGGSVAHTQKPQPQGPLLLRRRHWLREIVEGRMNWCGPLPRTADALERLGPRASSKLGETLPGVLAFSDLHGCESHDHPDEWLHALQQANLSRADQWHLIRRHWRRWF